MTKRRGTTSNNGFIPKKINENENENIKEKESCEPFWRAALECSPYMNGPSKLPA